EVDVLDPLAAVNDEVGGQGRCDLRRTLRQRGGLKDLRRVELALTVLHVGIDNRHRICASALVTMNSGSRNDDCPFFRSGRLCIRSAPASWAGCLLTLIGI